MKVRNNYRVLFHDEQLATPIWEEIKSLLPFRFGNSNAIGLNELFRFYKYLPGQHREAATKLIQGTPGPAFYPE